MAHRRPHHPAAVRAAWNGARTGQRPALAPQGGQGYGPAARQGDRQPHRRGAQQRHGSPTQQVPVVIHQAIRPQIETQGPVSTERTAPQAQQQHFVAEPGPQVPESPVLVGPKEGTFRPAWRVMP